MPERKSTTIDIAISNNTIRSIMSYICHIFIPNIVVLIVVAENHLVIIVMVDKDEKHINHNKVNEEHKTHNEQYDQLHRGKNEKLLIHRSRKTTHRIVNTFV